MGQVHAPDPKEKTEKLLREALFHANLAPPGSCRYVGKDGSHCIVGMALSLEGASNEALLGRKTVSSAGEDLYLTNNHRIRDRSDLHLFIKEHSLSLNMLVANQDVYDGGIDFDGEPCVKGNKELILSEVMAIGRKYLFPDRY